MAAEAVYRRALELNPTYPDALANLAGALRQQGRIAEAKGFYRRALEARSPWPQIHSNLIFCLDFDETAGLQEQAEERRRWQEANEAPHLMAAPAPAAAPDPGKERLRVGYVSADFNNHSAADGFGAVLLEHDRQRFEVTLYSNSDVEDRRTQEFMRHADRFRRVRLLTDDDLAGLIRQEGIDILVDLSGHSAGNRLPAFARRPAPVQVSGWGYATSTGLLSMDYLLADRWLVPWDSRAHYTESVLELPCVLSYRAPSYLPEPSPPPCARNGFVTFGNFNRLAKASPACIEAWSRVLHAVPRSRLILKCRSLDETETRQRVESQFAGLGIPGERLDLRGGSPHAAQLAMYGEVDVAMDSFRHCGGISTCEALIMGVPVVTLCGDVPVARNGSSIIAGLGCPEWIAFSVDEYVDKIVALANDSPGLATIRKGLRRMLRTSPLGDNAGYTRNVEAAYRRIWLRHCMGLGNGRPAGAGRNATVTAAAAQV